MVNSKHRFTRALLTKLTRLADAKLDDYLEHLETNDTIEAAVAGSRINNLTEKIAFEASAGWFVFI